jgi:hypothetical protein
VGVVSGDPWVAFGKRRRRILSCIRGWVSSMVVRGVICCCAWVPFVVGTEREVSRSGRGEMKAKNHCQHVFDLKKIQFFFFFKD